MKRSKFPYRSRLKILYDIIESIVYLNLHEGRARPTRVMYLSNLSYDRFTEYISELKNKGIICEDENGLNLTEKGKKFRMELRRILNALRAFGFEF